MAMQGVKLANPFLANLEHVAASTVWKEGPSFAASKVKKNIPQQLPMELHNDPTIANLEKETKILQRHLSKIETKSREFRPHDFVHLSEQAIAVLNDIAQVRNVQTNFFRLGIHGKAFAELKEKYRSFKHSKEWVAILQFEALQICIEEMDNLKNGHMILFCLQKVYQLMALGKLITTVIEAPADNLILSIGSHGGDPVQIFPDFVKELKGKTMFLNIDPGFEKDELIEKFSSENCQVYQFATAVNLVSDNQRIQTAMADMDEALEDVLQQKLANKVQKIMLFEHQGAYISELGFHLGRDHAEQLGNGLEIITDYGSNIHQPLAFQLSTEFFQGQSFRQCNENLIAGWKVAVENYDQINSDMKGLSPANRKKLLQDKWQKLIKFPIAGLYSHASDIEGQDLFKQPRPAIRLKA
jgi:hypothetical protein